MKLKSALKLALITLGTFGGLTSKAEICSYWGGEQQLSILSHKIFNEVSGIAASKKYPGRIYIVNDSEGGGRFYSYETSTGNFQTIDVEGLRGFDIEAISIGPCGNESCIYIGDIGNNGGHRRELVRIVGIKEQVTFPSVVTPHVHKKLNYPGEGQDAEAMVATKSGDFYIFTKKFDEKFDWDGVGPSHILKTTYRELLKPDTGKLEDVGRLYPQHIGNPTNVFTITDASLSDDESTIMFMTYFQGAEMKWPELLSKMGNANSNITLPYASYPTAWGPQAEAVTYLYPENKVVWGYESPDADSPLIVRKCEWN